MNKHKEYTRQELYDLVWTTPMVKLAKEFGLSDVGLRKICVRHDIPTPPLGYWAKLNFGKPVKRAPLGPLKEGVSDRVLVSLFTPVEVPDEVAEAAVSARKHIQAPIVVPDEPPTRFHPFAHALRRALRSAKPDNEGFLRVSRHSACNIDRRIASSADVTLMAPLPMTIRCRLIGRARWLSRLARREGLWAGRALHSPSRPQPRAMGQRS
jgi:hypothetical protein